MAFFEASEVVRKPQVSLIPKCGACGLLKTCKSPKMPVTGRGRMGVLVVAEAPGAEEDERNEQLIGEAGQELRRTLRSIDVDLDQDCWKTNALICRPPKNRKPTSKEIDFCRPNLLKAIEELRPKVIIPMGQAAARSVLGPHWKDDVGKISRWVGWKIPLHKPNVWIAPTYHPSYVMRERKDKSSFGPVLELWFRRHLDEAFRLAGNRPWEDPPDYESRIRLVYDPAEAAACIDEMLNRGGTSAFDYETDRLKPDADDSEIVSCAISWRGKETIAYPMVGEAVGATSRYLRSPGPKIGANNKFETRWSMRHFGHGVTNWLWDCVESAHHLDCRPEITSVKFQAFVRLGVSPWDYAVRPYLMADGGNDRNRIHQMDRRTLLKYNGMDALVEYHIAKHQRAEMMQQDVGKVRLESV